MSLARYINRFIIGAIMFIPYYVIFRPFFIYLDWLIDEEEEYKTIPTMDIAFQEFFKREINE